jgi:hypothetical protein
LEQKVEEIFFWKREKKVRKRVAETNVDAVGQYSKTRKK